MSDIVPTVAEINAANAVEELLGNAVRDNTGHFLGVFAGVSRNDIGRVIAEHTRPRAEAAESQAKIAWERHGEKDAAYQRALNQRDRLEVQCGKLQEAYAAKQQQILGMVNTNEELQKRVRELERLTAALRQVWIDDYESVHWSPQMDSATKSKLHQDAEAAFEKWKANQRKETP